MLYSIRQSSTSAPGFQQAGEGLHGQQPESQGKEGRMTAWIADVLIVVGLIVHDPRRRKLKESAR